MIFGEKDWQTNGKIFWTDIIRIQFYHMYSYDMNLFSIEIRIELNA